MNCQKFASVVSELARNQMMDAEQRDEALAHSERCDQCSSRLREEEILTRGFQSLAAEMQSQSAPPELEQKLIEAFRTRAMLEVPFSRKQSVLRYWPAAVAAVLLMAMGIVAVRWRANIVDVPDSRLTQELPKNREADREADRKPAEKLPETVVEQLADNSPKPQRKPVRPRSRRPANEQVANHITNEIATDFIPLRYMSAASLQDGGQIVRVELPRSALASFGLPVNMDRYNEKVKADVLLGVDGLAHAIRFVQ